MNNHKGYIAITTSIVLSLVILAVAVTFGSAGFFTRFDTVDFNDKRESYFLARSCMNYARYRLGLSSSYSGNQSVTISYRTCNVGSVTTSGSNKIIQAWSVVSGATTNLRLTVKRVDLSTVSLEELASF